MICIGVYGVSLLASMFIGSQYLADNLADNYCYELDTPECDRMRAQVSSIVPLIPTVITTLLVIWLLMIPKEEKHDAKY